MTVNENHAAALQVVRTLNQAGFESYLVGGCVRDLLLGRTPKDFDVTTVASPAEVGRLFPEDSQFVGAHFGVSLVHVNGHAVEVATFRNDGSYSDNRRPDSVEFTTDVREDVRRRDFTVNALLMTETGEVVDHVGGVADLNQRVLRCVGLADARFAEDALRMLRAVRFACQLDFTLAPSTEEAVRKNASRVQSVTAERVQVELAKMLTSGHADQGFVLLHELGLMESVLPELLPMFGCEHNNPRFHPEGDVATHTRLLLQGLPAGSSLTLALAALLHDMGKPATQQVSANKTTFHGHDRVGAAQAEALLRRLKFSNDVVETVRLLVLEHMKVFEVQHMRASTLRRFVRQAHFAELLELHRLDCLASNGNLTSHAFLVEFLSQQTAESLNPPRLLTGNDLMAMGLQPGPMFKQLLLALETEQLESRVTTRAAAVSFVHKWVRQEAAL